MLDDYGVARRALKLTARERARRGSANHCYPFKLTPQARKLDGSSIVVHSCQIAFMPDRA